MSIALFHWSEDQFWNSSPAALYEALHAHYLLNRTEKDRDEEKLSDLLSDIDKADEERRRGKSNET